MHASLPRGQTSGISVILSGRGFLTSFEGAHSSPTQPKRHAGGAEAGPAIPVKIQLLNARQGGYSIRLLRNDDRFVRTSPLINEDISEISVLHQTAREFDFVLNKDGSRHVMTFSNQTDGQQFLAIFTAVKTQEQPKMASAKRGIAAMAAKFPGVQGMTRLMGGGGGETVTTEKPEPKTEPTRREVPVDNGRVEQMDVHTLVECLKASIEGGDEENAVVFARNLAKQRPKLSILVETSGGPPPQSNGDISIQVQVEDRQASKLKLRMTVPPTITIAGLKKMTFINYDLPIQVQNWIINGRILKDNESLGQNQITSSGATLYLYLTSAEKNALGRQDVEIEKHALIEKNKNQRRKASREPPSGQWPSGAETQRRRTFQDRVIPPSSVDTLTSREMNQSLVPSPMRVSSGSSLVSGSGVYRSSDPLESRRPERKVPAALDVGWKCSQCTLVNPPLIPGCQACMAERPVGYRIPDKGSYVLDPSENFYLEGMQANEQALKEMEQQQQALNYQELLQVDEQDLVPNQEPFDCSVCFLEIENGEGVRLRECLHTFCRECLSEHVRHSTDALVKCPGMDQGVPCTESILEREIKALLAVGDYQKFLERSLRSAEATAANSFHCKSTDCTGFCFYEDNNNFFPCPLCHRTNCLTCKAIHEGINCKQYQEDLKIRAQNDVAAKQTQDTLQALVQTGEAMHCPQCSIIVQKKGGCDWLRCSVCQTEICWVTKQARWGKGGTGDISGGCRCRVNGDKCHPNCHNCH